jgi:mono/diheme cytochrome c family protein
MAGRRKRPSGWQAAAGGPVECGMTQGVLRRAERRAWVRPAVALAVGLGMAMTWSALAAAPAVAQQPVPAARYAWDGVFTDLQADRGEREYGRTCSHCHGLALEGDGAREIPTLISDPFMRHWRGRTAQALFDTLMRSMPADDRGSLTPRATADMIAYLLRANGAPSGDSPLSSERDALASVVFETK